MISSRQSAFIKGRYILESVVVAREMVHSVHVSNEPRVILKLIMRRHMIGLVGASYLRSCYLGALVQFG